ncbi:MAG: hypothetical protein R3A80_02920 [Bdellovibrionota bacterium]
MKNYLVVLFAIGSANFICAEGVGLGNGGLSRRQSNNQLKLVEHIGDQTCFMVEDNHALIREVAPKLVSRIQDIAKVDPALSFALWTDITDLHIRLCPFPLEKIKGCPKPTQKGEIVSGCRLTQGNTFGQKVYLATREVLKQHDRPEYIFIHESLHSIIPGNDQAHQQNVNEFSDYLYDHEGMLSRDLISRFLVEEMKSNYQRKATIDSSSYDSNAEALELAMSLVLSPGTSEETLCLLKNLGLRSSDTYTDPVTKIMKKLVEKKNYWPLWPSDCSSYSSSYRTRVFEILGGDFAKMFKVAGSVYSTGMSASDFDYSLFDCNWYAKADNVSKAESLSWAWNGIYRIQKQLQGRSASWSEEEQALLVIYFQYFPDVIKESENLKVFYVHFSLSPLVYKLVEEEAKGAAESLTYHYEARKFCRENFSWDSQNKEWVKQRASTRNRSSTKIESSPAKGSAVSRFFGKLFK